MTSHEWCCTHYFNQRLAQNANLVFHQSGSDAIVLYDKMPASALRNSPTATMQEAALCEQIDLCIPGLPEIPHTEDEKAKKHFSYPA